MNQLVKPGGLRNIVAYRNAKPNLSAAVNTPGLAGWKTEMDVAYNKKPTPVEDTLCR